MHQTLFERQICIYHSHHHQLMAPAIHSLPMCMNKLYPMSSLMILHVVHWVRRFCQSLAFPLHVQTIGVCVQQSCLEIAAVHISYTNTSESNESQIKAFQAMFKALMSLRQMHQMNYRQLTRNQSTNHIVPVSTHHWLFSPVCLGLTEDQSQYSHRDLEFWT